MSESFKSVFDAALSLPLAERAELATKLIASLDGERANVAERLLQSPGGKSQAEIDEAWAAEAEKRLRTYREGKIRSFSAEEVFDPTGRR